MAILAELKCTVCKVGDLPLSRDEINTFLPQIPEWQVNEQVKPIRLQRTYRFDDYRSALVFTQAVGELAEAEGHHPAILTEWGRVTVSWWTHKVNGLHENDFIMAAKTDQLYQAAIK